MKGSERSYGELLLAIGGNGDDVGTEENEESRYGFVVGECGLFRRSP